MPGRKISSLTPGDALRDNDAFPVARDNTTRQILGSRLLTPESFQVQNTPTINLNWNSSTKTLQASATLATTTQVGVAELATTPEVVNGIGSNTIVTPESLYTLLRALSTNIMNNIGNFPHVKAELIVSSNLSFGAPPFTNQLNLTNIAYTFGFDTAPVISSGGILLPQGKYNFKWVTGPLYNSEFQNTHLTEWSLVNRTSSNAVISRTPQRLLKYNWNGEQAGSTLDIFEGTFSINSSASVGVRLYISGYTYSWNNLQGSFSLRATGTNVSVGSLEIWKVG